MPKLLQCKQLREKMRNGESTCGAWLQLDNSHVADIMSRSGFDWLIIDNEHGMGDMHSTIQLQQAMTEGNSLPIIRVKGHNPDTIKRVLETGVFGILFPQVNSPEECKAIVNACKYPSKDFPNGIRGVGPMIRSTNNFFDFKTYLQNANDSILIVAQIENIKAVNQIDAIINVPGVDVFFVGAQDLAASMYHLGEPEHPEVQEAIHRVEEAAKRAGKALGTTSNGKKEEIMDLIKRGYSMITITEDSALIKIASANLVHTFKSAADEQYANQEQISPLQVNSYLLK